MLVFTGRRILNSEGAIAIELHLGNPNIRQTQGLKFENESEIVVARKFYQ